MGSHRIGPISWRHCSQHCERVRFLAWTVFHNVNFPLLKEHIFLDLSLKNPFSILLLKNMITFLALGNLEFPLLSGKYAHRRNYLMFKTGIQIICFPKAHFTNRWEGNKANIVKFINVLDAVQWIKCAWDNVTRRIAIFFSSYGVH